MARWIVFAFFCAALGAPTSAHAAHEVKERRTDYGGQIFVESGWPTPVSLGLAHRIRKAYRKCMVQYPDTGCHITFVHFGEMPPSKVARAIIGHKKMNDFAFNSIISPTEVVLATWLGRQEGLQTRRGTIIWVGPSDQFGRMTEEFRRTWPCTNGDSSGNRP